MVEPIEKALKIAGVDLTFSPDLVGNRIIKAVPNFDIYAVDASGGTKIEEAYYSFLLSTKSEVQLNLKPREFFTFQDDSYTYSFEVIDMNPDMTGWTSLSAHYITKEVKT